MKKYALIVLVLFLWNISLKAQSCPPGIITLVTQSDVDNFPTLYPDCHVIDAELIIGAAGPNVSDINNLNALSQITSVNTGLRITNTLLTNLNGLSNLDYVRYEVYIGNNSLLTDLGGFSNIHSIDGELRINENSLLLSLNGFNNLNSVQGIQVVGNPVMTSLNGLNNLKKVNGGISIGFNPALEQLDAFHQLDSIEFNGLTIYNNQSLAVLNAFEELQHIRTDLSFGVNPSLVSLSGLDSLQEVRSVDIYLNDILPNLIGLGGISDLQSLRISQNQGLVNLVGLSNLNSVEKLIVEINTSLINCVGLEKMVDVRGELFIEYNENMSSLHGLEGLLSAESIFLNSNNSLVDLTALVGLTETKALNIIDNTSLTNLNGLQNTNSLRHLTVYYNPILSDISSLGNSNMLEFLQIVDNPLLSNCSIYSVCNFVTNSVGALIQDNGPGCNDIFEVEISCGAVPVFTTVLLDNDGDCQADNNSIPLAEAQVHLSANLQMTIRPTNEEGVAKIGYLDSGSFLLDMPQFPTANWMVCQDTFTIDPANEPDTIRRTFLLKPLNQCPELSVELGLPPFFRGCLVNSIVSVAVTNVGTINAENVTVAVVMPSVLDLLSSIPPLAGQSGDTLYFSVGELAPFADTSIQMTVKTSCDTFLFGESLCLEAFGALSNPCASSGTSFSEIRLFSQCVGDTIVRFTIKNVGNAGTQGQHDYVIIEDVIILRSNDFSLSPFGSMTVDVPADGSTYRMEATKYDTGQKTATTKEGCGGLTPGFVTAHWFDRSLRNYDFDCREVILAYDPNEKSAIPKGIGSDNLIVANTPMDYTIEFQNTGTDTAFRVLLLDVLPPQVDASTFRPGNASHPHTWEINDGRLKVLFYPIALPDSNVNEAASHGFFSFSIDQKPNLPDGTTLKNTASIIFDFNPAIITNTVTHTIGKLLVSVDEPQRYTTFWKVSGNPTNVSATFSTEAFIPGDKRFNLVDVMGRVAQTEQFSGQSFEFQRGGIKAGLYFFSITDDKGRVFSGRIVIAD